MTELLHGAFVFFMTVIPIVIVLGIMRWLLGVPDELFRKLLHYVLLGVYAVILFSFDTWQIAASFAMLLVIFFFPVLSLLGRIPAFSSFVNERRHGEFRSSMVLALCMMAFSICICWGIFDDRMLVLACIYAWGVGDGFAALVGKRFGRHRIKFKYADNQKSVEGSAAMFVASSIAVFAVLALRGGLGFGECFIISAAAAGVSTFVEMCTKGGNDTVTCPLAAMAVILPLINLFGG